jgi:type VI protein secretion system component Hcp
MASVPRGIARWYLGIVMMTLVTHAGAGVAGWLRLDLSLRGEAKEPSHIDWIEIEGFGVRAPGNVEKLGGFDLEKRTDRSSPGIHLHCARGTVLKDVVLDLNVMDTALEPPVRIELEGVVITSHELSASSGRPLERLALSFTRIVYSYREASGAMVKASYDQINGAGSSVQIASPDSEQDGLPDSWESQYGLQVGVNDAASDPDGDGMSNLDEFRLGTHPRSGASFFRVVLQPVQGQPRLANLQWNSVAGKTYVVEWSPDLKTPFSEVQSVTASGAVSTCLVSRSGVVGFYRVRLQ